MNKRIHAYYSGSVQGIGFRFTAERIATSLNLTGWVKNLRDGRVEVVCEGQEVTLQDFLRQINSTFNNSINDADIKWSEATGKFDNFDIRLH